MMKSMTLAGIFCVCFAGFANAATFSGNFTGTIDAPINPSTSIRQKGGGTNSLAWGTTTRKSNKVVSGDSSSLTVNNGTFGGTNVGAGRLLLGTITWNNQSNWKAGTNWDSNVNLALDFGDPSNPAPVDLSVGFSMVNTLDLTTNTNVNEKTGRKADWMILDTNAFGGPISLGQGLVLTGVFFDMMSPGSAGKNVNGIKGVSYGGYGSRFGPSTGKWLNREGGTSTMAIYGQISAVPLPAGVWLMLGGLGGLAAVSRRRTKKIAS